MTVSPYQILFRVASGENVLFELYEWAVAQVPRAIAHHHGAVRIPPDDADEHALDTLLRLHALTTTGDRAGNLLLAKLRAHPELRNGGLDRAEVVLAEPVRPIVRAADGVVTRYFRLMLGTGWLNEEARRRREREHAEAERLGAAESQRSRIAAGRTGEEPAAQALREARASLEEPLRHVLARRNADAELLRTSVEQLWQLRAGAVDMRALAEAEAEADPELRQRDDGWRTARDRLYRRHRLARRYLREAVDALEAEGALAAEVAGVLHDTLRGLARRKTRQHSGDNCPNPDPSSVPGDEEAT